LYKTTNLDEEQVKENGEEVKVKDIMVVSKEEKKEITIKVKEHNQLDKSSGRNLSKTLVTLGKQ